MGEDNLLVRRLHAAYSAFNDSGDVSSILAEVDPGVEMVLSMGGPEGTLTFRGHDGIAEWVAGLGDAWRDVAFEPLEVEVDETGRRALVVVRVSTRGRASDLGLERMEAHVLALGPSGKVERIEGFTDLETARAAFESP